MQAHADYLAALTIPARSDRRPEHVPTPSGCVVVSNQHVE